MILSLDGYAFGEPELDLFLTDVDLDLGDVLTDDVERPLGHGARPGADRLGAGALRLSLCTSPHIGTEADASAAIGRFLGAWRAALAAPPGALVPLTARVGDRSRVIYGRPGRAAPQAPGSLGMREGRGEVEAEFRVLDPYAYAAAPESVSLSVTPRSLGGIVTPLVAPVTSLARSGVEYRMLTVPGDAPAPLAVTFRGPANDPSVTVGGATVGIRGAIAYDEEITVDGRARTVTLGDGSPASARLTRASRLDRLTVPPGVHEIAFTANDRTGTAHATIAATPAYYSI